MHHIPEARPERVPDGYTSIRDACRLLRRSRWTIYRLIAAGELTVLKEGNAPNGRVFILQASIDAYLEANRVQPATSAEAVQA
ncbi:helix-turn-helix domain-containing protein [Nonomuraea sp. NPDC048882]|uniref:helix-turn-helix domain-containing protein n=1 Tax=Nonomuraea sp. NPDC048882 TaxID=3154347 RepID=UPI0033C9B58D